MRMTIFRTLVALLGAAIFGWVTFYLWPFFTLFSLTETLWLIGMAVGILALGWMPVIYPLFKIFRMAPVAPWRFAFVFVVVAITYGAAVVLLTVLGLPLQLYLVYVAPQLEAMGERVGEPLVVASALFVSYWWLALPLALSTTSAFLTNYLLPRWPQVVSALRR